MTMRIPIVPTIVVVAAALLMIRLGVWQLHRLLEKEALLDHYAANAGRPPLPLAALVPLHPDALFRRTTATCRAVTGWTAEVGRSASGASGWRHIASCRADAGGPGFAADMGVSQSAAPPAGWTGGPVRGWLTEAPDGLPLVARLFAAPAAPTPMIVSAVAAPGLSPAAPPNPADVPNNHLAYAVQWFLFAAVALAVYGTALWQRRRKARLP